MESYWKQSSKQGKKKKCKYKNKSVSDLFADTDGDGVANVFDCSPRNKRKQDMSAIMSSLKSIAYKATPLVNSVSKGLASANAQRKPVPKYPSPPKPHSQVQPMRRQEY